MQQFNVINTLTFHAPYASVKKEAKECIETSVFSGVLYRSPNVYRPLMCKIRCDDYSPPKGNSPGPKIQKKNGKERCRECRGKRPRTWVRYLMVVQAAPNV